MTTAPSSPVPAPTDGPIERVRDLLLVELEFMAGDDPRRPSLERWLEQAEDALSAE